MRYLEFLYFPSQRGVGADMLEERRFKADPQVGFLPVTVFLTEKQTGTITNSFLLKYLPSTASEETMK